MQFRWRRFISGAYPMFVPANPEWVKRGGFQRCIRYTESIRSFQRVDFSGIDEMK